MKQQLSIFDQPTESIIPVLPDDYTGLTDRQIALDKFIKGFEKAYGYEPSDYEVLVNMDDEWYGYYAESERKNLSDEMAIAQFNNLTARRELTKDKEALRFHTGTTKVFLGNGYAKTRWQGVRQALKYYIEGKKAFRKMSICWNKIRQDGQLSFDFDDFTEDNPIREYVSTINKLDYETIKEMSVAE